MWGHDFSRENEDTPLPPHLPNLAGGLSSLSCGCALPPSQGVQRERLRLCYLQTARETQVPGNKAFHPESIEGVSQTVRESSHKRLLQWLHTGTQFFFLRTCSLSHLEEHPYQFMHRVCVGTCVPAPDASPPGVLGYGWQIIHLWVSTKLSREQVVGRILYPVIKASSAGEADAWK